MPLGDGLGVQGLQFGDPTFVTVGSTSTLVLSAANTANTEYISLVNDSNETIYIGVGSAAVSGRGIRLNASGGTVVWEGSAKPKNVAIYAICASGSKNLCVQVAS